MAKKRIVKDYDQIPDEVKMLLKHKYPEGYSENLIKFTNASGKNVSALPFETDEIYYLIRMTVEEAIQIVEEGEEFDDFSIDLKIPVESKEIASEIESEIEEEEYDEEYDAYDDKAEFDDEDD